MNTAGKLLRKKFINPYITVNFWFIWLEKYGQK